MFAARQRFVMGSQRSPVIGWTRGNTGVSISSAQSKFTNAGSLDVEANFANWTLASASTSLIARGTGNFTIEGWFYPTVRSNNFPCAFTNDNAGGFGTNDWGLYPGHNAASTKWQFYVGNVTTATYTLVSTSNITYNAWTHVAITRSGNTWDFWINGTSEHTRTLSQSLDGGASRAITFGNVDSASLVTKWRGYISEARISDIARYTSGFTPATTPFIDDPNTLMLFHGTGPATNFIDDNS